MEFPLSKTDLYPPPLTPTADGTAIANRVSGGDEARGFPSQPDIQHNFQSSVQLSSNSLG